MQMTRKKRRARNDEIFLELFCNITHKTNSAIYDLLF